MLLLSLAFRNALRNRRRSLLTAATIMFGTGFLNAGIAWQDGVLDGALDTASANAGHVRIVTEAFSRKEALFPIAENMADVAPITKAVAAVDGVTGVYARLQMPVTMSVGEEIGEVFGLAEGAEMPYFLDVIDLDQHLFSGTMFKEDGETVMGKALAEELGATLGSEVVLLGQTQDGSISPIKVKVVGISDLGSGAQNKKAYLTLSKAQWMADMDGGATEILVYGTTREDGAPLAAAIAAVPECKGLEVKAWDQRPPWSDMMGLMNSISYIGVGVIVFITALAVLNTMMMSVLERTAEIGVLRAMGLKRLQTVVLFVTEGLGIAVVGGLGGAILGGLMGLYLEIHGINLGAAVDKIPATIPINSTVYADVTPATLVQGMLLGLLMAVIGSALPALRAASIQPIDAMRTRR